MVGNRGSWRVLGRVGCKKEGILRSADFVRGKNLHMELFSILREKPSRSISFSLHSRMEVGSQIQSR